MVEDLTVLLVGDDEPDEKLVEQLEKKSIGVEISSKDEFESLLALVEPHIVLHTGFDGAAETAAILKATEEVRRVRLIVRADRKDLPQLRQLDKTVVVSVLASDIAPSVVAARVLMLAKKGPEKSLRPPKPAEKQPIAPPKIEAAPPPPKITTPQGQKEPAITDRKPVVPKKPGAVAPPMAKKPAVPKAAKSLPPRATPSKAAVPRANTPPSVKKDDEIEEAPISLEAIPQSSDTPPSSNAPPSEFPTMAFEAPIPEAARPAVNDVRVVLADSDVTRADIIACDLRERGIPTRIVPLDAAATHWPLVREFSPTILLGDGALLKSTGAVWLQLFQADQELKKAKLVAVPFERLFKADEGKVNLRTLIPQIPQLSGVEVSSDPKPTTGPSLNESPLPAAGSPAAAPEAPEPFEDDDEDEFERMTVARPIDEPLPAEALSSQGPGLPPPAAGNGPEPIPDSLRGMGLNESIPETAAQPITDVLAEASTVQPTSAPSGKTPSKQPGGGAKWAIAALLIGAGAAGGFYFIKGTKPAPAPAADPASQQDSAPTPKEPTAPEPEVIEPPPIDPEIARWMAAPATPVPECERLVTNLEELSSRGIQQATLSLNKARQSMVRGELDDALKLMCEAVLVHPKSMALEELASLYVTKRSPEQALKWHAKALEARPERPRTIELGGDIYNQLGRLDESRDAYVSSLKVDGSDTKTLHAVGKQYAEDAERALKAGSFAKADLLFRRAAVLNPENADATAGLAATSAAIDDKKAARAWAEKTLSMDEGQHIALVVMAALATEAGDTQRAADLCKKALERNPNYPLAHQLLHQLQSK